MLFKDTVTVKNNRVVKPVNYILQHKLLFSSTKPDYMKDEIFKIKMMVAAVCTFGAMIIAAMFMAAGYL